MEVHVFCLYTGTFEMDAMFNSSNDFTYNVKTYEVKLVKEWGENTLQWSPLGCHIVLLSSDVHVWAYPTSNFWNIFTIFLHIMLEYNLGKKFKKKLFHFIL